MKFRFRDWPVKWKLLGVGAAATALPLVVTSFLAFRSGSALIRHSALALLGARADQLAGDLDAFHDAFRRSADRLATMPAVKEFCWLPPAGRRNSEAGLEAMFGAFAAADPRTHIVALFDREGTVTAATFPAVRGRNYAFRRYFQSAAAGHFTISELFISATEAGAIPTIAYAAPVKDAAGEVHCVALVVARAQEFWDVIMARNGTAGPGSHSVLYDEYGIRIAQSFKSADLFHPAGPLDAATVSMFAADRRFGENTRQLLEAPVPTEEEFVRARGGELGEAFTARSRAGVLNLGIGRRLRSVPWTLFYLAPEPTLLAPVRQLILDSVSANGAILGLALIAGLFLARGIIVPVRRLNDAARSIREGNLAATVPVTSADELGELASMFNDMAAALQGAREELEEKVRLRTEALKAANESLELRNQTLAQRSAELTARQERDLAYGRALTTLTGEGALGTLLEAALRDVSAFCSAPVLVCYRLSEHKLVPIAEVGLGTGGEAAVVPLTGTAEEALGSGRTVVVEPLPAEMDLRFDVALAAGRPQAVALVPLRIGEREVGLLAAGALQRFQPDAVQFLSDLALPLALTIVRHDLYRQTGEFAEQLAKTNEELQLQTEELHAQRQDLEAKNVEIEKADRLKSEFLANMSHELRTPLNAIIGFSELLLEEARPTLSSDHVKFVEDVLASGRHLLALINDILDLAKIESGRIELHLEPIGPESAIRDAVALVEPQAQRKGIEIRRQVSASTAVLADGGKLRQVLLNLLSNAVKFSAEKTVVEIGAEEAPSAVRFWVRDQGPGIDGVLMGRLFQPFVQGESTLVRKHQGTGLGLAISKRLAEEHGGRIEVESTPGQGSTFYLTIPTVAASAPWAASALAGITPEAAAANATPPAIEEPRGEGPPVVLLVEDDPATIRLVRAYLRDAGFELAVANDCANALELARRLKPTVVLLDLDLDGEDGLQVLQELKADPATREIPVVIESVLAEQKRGLLLGASDYVTKPLDRTRLLESIARLRQPDTTGEKPLVLAIDDDPIVATVLRSVLGPAGFRIRTAALGREGIELARTEKPMLVIVDLLLPDISGFEVVDALSADVRTRDLPIIALTAATLSLTDRQRLEKRVFSLAQKGDFTRESVLLAVQRAIGISPPASAANGPTMLVVDDHDLNRELIRTVLERKGYRVLLADNGDAGIAIAKRERPSLILLDLAMPGKDGFETVRELKADRDLATTPVVAVTAMAMRGDEERARNAGFDGYVSKPVDRRTLEETVERLLKRMA